MKIDYLTCNYCHETYKVGNMHECMTIANLPDENIEAMRRLLMQESEFDVELAIKLSKIVHDKCKGVPHDIGITLADEVKRHFK